MRKLSSITGLERARPDQVRRSLLLAGAAVGGGSLLDAAGAAEMVNLPMANGAREVAAFPQKRPLIVLTERPVQLETPLTMLNEVFTPNDAFFVRWHLSAVPTSIDGNAFRIKVRGLVKNPLELGLKDLMTGFEQVEIAAVCQCSGNSRGLFEPRVAGGQWANGAMGNALWKGVRLRDILNKAGMRAGAAQIRFNGLDSGPMTTIPDFIKALDVDDAVQEDVIVAYQMNGEPLPLLNGYPVRLIVPGWYATYWVKMLDDIEVIGGVDSNFWMKPAYRIPDNACACVEPGKPVPKSVPIGRMNTRSFITSHADGARVAVGQMLTVKGIAFDGGFGIQRVMLSSDSGRTWGEVRLGMDYGKYSFRMWEGSFKADRPGQYELQVMAVNRNGDAQRASPRWNPAGYMRNVIESVRLVAA